MIASNLGQPAGEVAARVAFGVTGTSFSAGSEPVVDGAAVSSEVQQPL